MDSPWVNVFLGVIAVTALLQAGFVAGLAIAARTGGRKLAALEKQIDAQVLSLAPRVVQVADKVVEASGQVRRQAARTEALVTDATTRVEKALVRARGRIIEAGERMERKASDLEHEELDPLRDRINRVAAVARGVRRALEVWRGDSD
ncbi:MAG TPA: hypothetical protein VFM29_01545 [Vicinamibacteria bacterium]|nr:hypothetical protein [Vicinamibacteria bacterium]